MHSHIRAYIHMCMHSHIHAYIHMCMHSHIRAYIHMCMHSHIRTCIHTHVHVCHSLFPVSDLTTDVARTEMRAKIQGYLERAETVKTLVKTEKEG